MSECARHPGQDTMVPCLGCGKSFCRICEPPQGAGQYCPNCYREQVARLSGGGERQEDIAAAKKKRLKPMRRAGKKEPAGMKATGARPKAERSRVAGIAAGALNPFTWTGRKVAAGAGATRRATVRSGQVVKKGAGDATLATGRGVKDTALEVKDRFPIGLAPTEVLEGDPPLTTAWPKLVGIVLGGALLWTILVAIFRVREPAFSICVGILVAGAAVWAMGTKFGAKVGIVTVGLVLVSLAFGELAVMLLYRAHFLITKLDLVGVDSKKTLSDIAFYRSFAFKLALYRLLPAAAVAFLIGLWPLKKRLSWVGFEGRSRRARRLPPFRKRAEVNRPGAAGGQAGASAAGRKKEQKATAD